MARDSLPGLLAGLAGKAGWVPSSRLVWLPASQMQRGSHKAFFCGWPPCCHAASAQDATCSILHALVGGWVGGVPKRAKR